MGRVLLTDDSGTPTAEITGIYLQRVQRRTVPMPLTQKIFDDEWVHTADRPRRRAASRRQLAGVDRRRRGGVRSHKEFAHAFSSPTRRLVSAELSKESAVMEAFSKRADDPSFRRSASSSSPDSQPFDGTESGDSAARGRDLTWGVASTVRAIIGGWHGKAPRLWLVSRNGLAVNTARPW